MGEKAVDNNTPATNARRGNRKAGRRVTQPEKAEVTAVIPPDCTAGTGIASGRVTAFFLLQAFEPTDPRRLQSLFQRSFSRPFCQIHQSRGHPV